MKIFDKWIEKQFYKRNPDIKALMNPMKVTAIHKEEIHPIKHITMLTLPFDIDDVMPYHRKEEMLAHQLTPRIIDNLTIIREEDAITRQAVYYAQIEIVPRKERNNAL